MSKIKIQDIKTGAVKEVEDVLVGDFIGTGDFKIYVEKEKPVEISKKTLFGKTDVKEK